ncbi:MAG: carboxypeptidase regulatory-like domain-containing protein [Roseiflexaceae bacterium]|nr:carboxypeptidase regulatory-like domain-containing protein [Roseiflexaceae bacterium]
MRRAFPTLALLLISTLLASFAPLLPSAQSAAIAESPAGPPTSLTAALSSMEGAMDIAAGVNFSCALMMDGTVRCWGKNSEGQLGYDLVTTENPTPGTVIGLGGVVSVTAGGFHACALLADRTVRCWGANFYGQLGGGDDVGPFSPPIAVNGLNGVTAVAAGLNHTCALLSDRTVRCWGWNNAGQLGDGTSTNRSTPVAVNGLSNVAAIAAGAFHTCAVLANGAVRCWGWNNAGQLGIGTTGGYYFTPVAVNGLSQATDIAAGGEYTCVVLSDRTVRCWGSNAQGQIGDGTTAGRPAPVAVSGLSDVMDIEAGGVHVCVIRTGGAIQCWGGNAYGALGDGTTTNRLTPVAVSGLSNAIAIAAGSGHTCALSSDGAAWCWGRNDYGELGDGSVTGKRAVPAAVSGLHGIAMITAGGDHTCALSTNRTVWCWGENAYGQLGDGTNTDRPVPVMVNGLNNVTGIAAGTDHTCAVLTDGTVRCWGRNHSGQLGDGSTTDRPAPAPVNGLTNVTSLAAGPNYTCAVLAGGTVRCWGTNSSTPAVVPGLAGVMDVAASAGHTCALLSDGTVQCWSVTSLVPGLVNGLSGVIDLAGGWLHTCAVLNNGTMRCWGANWYGQLGDGSTTSYPTTPATVSGLSGASKASAGRDHTCALLNDGTARCWGAGFRGQLGDGVPFSYSTVPVVVKGLSGASAIASGHEHNCALLATGTVQCWGSNSSGQLGDGRFGDNYGYSTVPVAVFGIGGSLPHYTITGSIRDASGAPVAGVTVSDGVRSATTDASGNYALANVPAGTYILTPSRSGYAFSPPNRTVTVSGNVSGVDFTAALLRYTIAGRVLDNSGNPVAGVTVSDGVRSATTDASGNYALANVPAGTYILTPSRSGYAFSPPNRTVTVSGNVSGVDFTADPVSSVKPIDLTVWFYRVPTPQQRAIYEDMFRSFADAVFEMSNGAHKLRNVRIVFDPALRPQANVHWVEHCWPNAHISGYGVSGLRILMCDKFTDNNGVVVFDYLNASDGPEQGGYTLAHELGHYYYSLYDEYRRRAMLAIPVLPAGHAATTLQCPLQL